MNLRTLVISGFKVILLTMVIHLVIPHPIHAQKRRAKRKVVRVAPARHYAHLPKYGTYVIGAPVNSRIIRFNHTAYRFHKGVFYKPVNGRFTVVAPPVGIRISALPAGYRTIVLNNRRYFYTYGTFYLATGKEFEVIQPPVGALVESIPDGYEEVVIDGNTYYLVANAQYKAVVREGEIWYEVIKAG